MLKTISGQRKPDSQAAGIRHGWTTNSSVGLTRPWDCFKAFSDSTDVSLLQVVLHLPPIAVLPLSDRLSQLLCYIHSISIFALAITPLLIWSLETHVNTMSEKSISQKIILSPPWFAHRVYSIGRPLSAFLSSPLTKCPSTLTVRINRQSRFLLYADAYGPCTTRGPHRWKSGLNIWGLTRQKRCENYLALFFVAPPQRFQASQGDRETDWLVKPGPYWLVRSGLYRATLLWPSVLLIEERWGKLPVIHLV